MFRTIALVAMVPATALGQTYSSAGQNWVGSFSFPTVSDRSLAIQQAQALWNVENPQKTEITYNSYYDSRTNYVETNASGNVQTDYQIGDDIGKQTYSVGSLNTGSTSIEVNGQGNSIIAENAAENTGCVDGSLLDLNASSTGSGVENSRVGSVLDLADLMDRATVCK